MTEHHQRVEPQIGCFVHECLTVAAAGNILCRDDRLDGLFADFAILYRLLHATRLPLSSEAAAESLIERYHQDSLDSGARIREGLSAAVENAILTFGNGFIAHPDNKNLRELLASGQLTAEDYYGLAGVFKSTQTMDNFSVVARWHERPLATPDEIKLRDEAAQRVASHKQMVEKLKTDATEVVLNEARQHAGMYLLAATREKQKADLVKHAKPRGADPNVTDIAGAVLIEAEDFARGNVIKDRETYGKGIGVLLNKGETPNFTEYDIDLARDATYQFELRYAAAGSRPVKVFVDGQLVKADAAKAVTGSWTLRRPPQRVA